MRARISRWPERCAEASIAWRFLVRHRIGYQFGHGLGCSGAAATATWLDGLRIEDKVTFVKGFRRLGGAIRRRGPLAILLSLSRVLSERGPGGVLRLAASGQPFQSADSGALRANRRTAWPPVLDDQGLVSAPSWDRWRKARLAGTPAPALPHGPPVVFAYGADARTPPPSAPDEAICVFLAPGDEPDSSLAARLAPSRPTPPSRLSASTCGVRQRKACGSCPCPAPTPCSCARMTTCTGASPCARAWRKTQERRATACWHGSTFATYRRRGAAGGIWACPWSRRRSPTRTWAKLLVPRSARLARGYRKSRGESGFGDPLHPRQRAPDPSALAPASESYRLRPLRRWSSSRTRRQIPMPCRPWPTWGGDPRVR